MLGGIKKVIEDVFSKAAYDLSKYLFFVFLAGFAGLAAHIYASNTKYLIPYAVIFAISIGAGVGFIGVCLYKRFNPIYKIYSKTDFKYVILQKDCIFEYKDLNHMIYQKQIRLKVLCENLDRYYDKYNWTGCQQPKICSADKDHIILLTTKRDAFQQFEIHLGRNYKKGEIIDIHLTFELEDNENKSMSILSSTIVEPTKCLKLKVKVPKEYIKDKANAEVFPLVDSRIALEKYDRYFDNNGIIEWEISDPKMLLVYSLTWNMSKL